MPNKISKYQFLFDKSVVILSDSALVEKGTTEREYEGRNGRLTSPDTRQKRCEQHGKVTVRIASFVGSKVIQRLVKHGLLCLTTPWIASMIDEWVGHWQGKTEVLGDKMLSCQPVHHMSPHELSWNRTHTYAVKCWQKNRTNRGNLWVCKSV